MEHVIMRIHKRLTDSQIDDQMIDRETCWHEAQSARAVESAAAYLIITLDAIERHRASKCIHCAHGSCRTLIALCEERELARFSYDQLPKMPDVPEPKKRYSVRPQTPQERYEQLLKQHQERLAQGEPIAEKTEPLDDSQFKACESCREMLPLAEYHPISSEVRTNSMPKAVYRRSDVCRRCYARERSNGAVSFSSSNVFAMSDDEYRRKTLGERIGKRGWRTNGT
jgi:hypothetical protein